MEHRILNLTIIESRAKTVTHLTYHSRIFEGSGSAVIYGTGSRFSLSYLLL
ncbi:unnamed protein product [Callosobruchus maculatus]|uniref:Uncharacterized protein n=1 Tax=Callosobruchus maculatus TaxID=64391 RepID=A0A653BU24_CALMS|nr:unnamed protein product [Callosobruchus maculatus]